MWCDNRPTVTLRLQLNKEGLGMILGPLELALMQALWEAEVPATNKEIRLILGRSYGDLTPATISTTMHRLAEKGYITEKRVDNWYLYEPTFTEAQLEQYLVHSVMACLDRTWPVLVDECVEIMNGIERVE